MEKLPKLYAPIKVKFWTLRTYGNNFDVDYEMERKIRRVRASNNWRDGWKWQICLTEKNQDYWDCHIEVDDECLNNSDLEDLILL